MANLETKVDKGHPKRAQSSERLKGRAVRAIPKEKQLRFDEGFLPEFVFDDHISENLSEMPDD
jgi:hypothetical protein